MHWWLLCLAIVLEVSGTVAMKISNGFEKTLPVVFMAVFYLASFYALGESVVK